MCAKRIGRELRLGRLVTWLGCWTLAATMVLVLGNGARTQDTSTPQELTWTAVRDISYYPEERITDDYQRSQCRLDLFLPKDMAGTKSTKATEVVAGITDSTDTEVVENTENSETDENGGKTAFATIVWFHGGGLTGGRRYLPESLRTVALERERIAIVAVGYRLSPRAPLPTFIEDAAAAAAWVKRNIGEYGGDPNRVFLCGGSAGGYLTAMVGMDPRWLEPYGLKPQDFAGLIPVSAQVTTHFHVKQLRNIPGDPFQPVIDEYAPLAYLAVDLPPMLLVLGDRRIEWKARVEENELMAAALRAMGHPDVTFRDFPGFDHGISALAKDCEPDVIGTIVDFVKGH